MYMCIYYRYFIFSLQKRCQKSSRLHALSGFGPALAPAPQRFSEHANWLIPGRLMLGSLEKVGAIWGNLGHPWAVAAAVFCGWLK